MDKQLISQMNEFFSREDSRVQRELGLQQIDDVVNGLPKGKLVTIIGQSVDGRDTMLNTLVKNLAIDQRIPSLILNLATSEDVFYYELMANITNAPIDEIRIGETIPPCEPLSKVKTYVDFPEDRSLEYIEKTIRQYASGGIEIVFIDLFQAVNYKDDIDYFAEDELLFFKEKNSKRLYTLAKELNINIIIGAAVSNYIDEREGFDSCRPKLKDAMFAGRLDEYSDLIFGVFIPNVHRILYDEQGKDLSDFIEVEILKNEINHKIGRFSLKNDIHHCRVFDDSGFNKELVDELKEKNPAFDKLVTKFGLEQTGELICNQKLGEMK